jgi:hypothetical protein
MPHGIARLLGAKTVRARQNEDICGEVECEGVDEIWQYQDLDDANVTFSSIAFISLEQETIGEDYDGAYNDDDGYTAEICLTLVEIEGFVEAELSEDEPTPILSSPDEVESPGEGTILPERHRRPTDCRS